MDIKGIGILISQLEGFRNPKLSLEQYETDGNTVTLLISEALSDILGRDIIDMGCGTGFLTIALSLAGARFVVGVDIDIEALRIAQRNIKSIREITSISFENTHFICADVCSFNLKRRFDVCVMNPPFGIRKKGMDRIFLKKAFEFSDIIWTFLGINSEPFVRKFAYEHGFYVSRILKTKIQLRKKFRFHKKHVEFLPVDLYRIEKSGKV